MATREVVDCDLCQMKDMKEYVTLYLLIGDSWEVSDAKNRPHYQRVQICTTCCGDIMKTILRREQFSTERLSPSLNDELLFAIRHPPTVVNLESN